MSQVIEMMQMVMTPIEEDILASRIRSLQVRINELVQDVEERNISRAEMVQKVKEVEKGLRRTRQDL